MKRFSGLLVTLTLLTSIAWGQNTPEALGQIAFNSFQQDDLDSFYRLIPSITEIVDFGATIGIDTTSDQYSQFVKGYPLGISNFKEKCSRLSKSTTDFNWTLAKLEKIQKSQKIIPIDNRDTNSKAVTITVIDIYFYSNDKRFKLTLGDANCYGGIWKPGNNINIIKL
jgi:hypothetical protein